MLKAEFTVDQRAVPFDLQAEEPPARTNILAKKCAKSPTLHYELEFDRMDGERGIALYRVLGARTIFSS